MACRFWGNLCFLLFYYRYASASVRIYVQQLSLPWFNVEVFPFFFLVEVKGDLEQMRKGIEELIDKSNISKTEEERTEGQFQP